MKSFLTKESPLWRYITGIIILVIIIPIFFLSYYVGIPGRITSFIIYSLIGSYGLFEIFKKMNMAIYSKIYLSLLIFIFLLLPIDNFLRIARISEGYDDVIVAIRNAIDWKGIVILVASSALPTLFDSKLRKLIQSMFFEWMIIISLLIVISFFVKTLWILNCEQYWVALFFIAIPIITDTFGYIGGKYFGKYIFRGAKLAPKLSPKKTWAGFMFGYIAGVLFISLVGWFGHIFSSTNHEVIFLIISIIFLPIVAPVGDLAFSGLKRYLGIKDFSNLLPGHGGIMDRLDSMSLVFFVVTILFTFSLI